MTAPERIWVTGNAERGIWTAEDTNNHLHKLGYKSIFYLRADIAAALVAERDALRSVLEGMEFRDLDGIAKLGRDEALALGKMAKQAILGGTK